MAKTRNITPKLENTPPVPGCGAGRTDVEWLEELIDYRPRLMALSSFEMDSVLIFAEYGDLVGLVISPPFDKALLERFCAQLDPQAATTLMRDCATYRDAFPGADLACGTCERLNGMMQLFELPRASPEEVEAIRTMTLQLAARDDPRWFHERSFFLFQIFPLLKLTGGLEGALGSRIEVISNDEEWQYLERCYSGTDDEPLFAGAADRCERGLKALLDGKPWETDSLVGEKKELARAEIEALLDSSYGMESEAAPCLPNLFRALDDDEVCNVLSNIGTLATFSLARILAASKDAALARKLLNNYPERRRKVLISALAASCAKAE